MLEKNIISAVSEWYDVACEADIRFEQIRLKLINAGYINETKEIIGLDIYDKPCGWKDKNGTYVSELPLGKKGGQGRLFIPIKGEKRYLGVDYEY